MANRSVFLSMARGLLLRVAGAIANFLFFVVIGRMLGISETGTYMLGFGFVTILSAIGRLGLEQIVVREATPMLNRGDWFGVSVIYKSSIYSVLIASFLLALLLYVVGFGHDFVRVASGGFLGKSLVWVCLSIPAVSLAYIHVPYLQAAKRPELSVALLSFWIPFFSLCLIGLFKIRSAEEASCIYFFSALLSVVLAVLFWKRIVRNELVWRGVDAIPKAKQLVMLAAPILVGNFFLMALPWIGIYVTGFFGTVAAVGVLSISQRISMTISGFLMPPIEAIVGPKLAGLKDGDVATVEAYCRKLSLVLTLLVLLILVFVSVFGEEVLKAFGSGFEGGYVSLVILCVGQLVFVACGPTRLVLIFWGQERFLRNSMAGAALACLLGCVILVPALGDVGAAVSTSLAIAIQKISEMYVAYKRIGIKTYPFFLVDKNLKY